MLPAGMIWTNGLGSPFQQCLSSDLIRLGQRGNRCTI
jgi:hypothetical protein